MSFVRTLEEWRKKLSALNRKRKAVQHYLPLRASMPIVRRRAALPAGIKNVLFIHTSGGTGDALYVLGMMRHLAAQGVQASIGTLEKHVPIFKRSGLFREVFVLGAEMPETLDFDCAVDLEYVAFNHYKYWNERLPLLKRLDCWRMTTAPLLKNAPLFDEYIDYSMRAHISERFGLVCGRVLNDPSIERIMPFVPVDAQAEAEALPFISTLIRFRHIIYLNTQAGDEDRWFSKAQTLALLSELIKLPETAVVVLPPTQGDESDYIVSPQVFLLPALSFPGFSAFLRSTTWVVTPDTSVTHVAAHLDKPCLTFFPPNDRDYFKQYGAWEAWGALSTVSETVHPDAPDLHVDKYGTANYRTGRADEIPIPVLLEAVERFSQRLGFPLKKVRRQP